MWALAWARCGAPLTEMPLVPLIKAADLSMKFWSLIPWGLSLSSCCETFICF